MGRALTTTFCILCLYWQSGKRDRHVQRLAGLAATVVSNFSSIAALQMPLLHAGIVAPLLLCVETYSTALAPTESEEELGAGSEAKVMTAAAAAKEDSQLAVQALYCLSNLASNHEAHPLLFPPPKGSEKWAADEWAGARPPLLDALLICCAEATIPQSPSQRYAILILFRLVGSSPRHVALVGAQPQVLERLIAVLDREQTESHAVRLAISLMAVLSMHPPNQRLMVCFHENQGGSGDNSAGVVAQLLKLCHLETDTIEEEMIRRCAACMLANLAACPEALKYFAEAQVCCCHKSMHFN